MSVLFAIPVDLAYHLVCWLAAILAPLPGGLAATVAIVAFTVAVRLVLLPLSYYALRGERARAQLQPRVQELRRRYASQPERLQRELPALYRAEGTSMFAGCLPLLLQIPVFSLMYRLFVSHSVAGGPNTLLAHSLLATPLGSQWLTGAGPISAHGAVFAVLFALLAVVGGLAVRAARPTEPKPASNSKRAPEPKPAPEPKRALEPKGANAAKGASAAKEPAAATGAVDRAAGLLTRLMPFGSLVLAAIVPLAAGLYLLTTAAWTLAERAMFRRRLDHSAGG
jgi:YidC/Oxa1 family membrane protein insertase